ncbi:hypothetical protein JCM19240_2871 [Vibrio maritimus]|uniref:Uncharacterized protein n=1 Tax=Vibrio maritimus TaxID=990268 RepID=A0A090U198_9VIBR|nr:hypothetical protein JCM19240_2871 [Vibrio maritimus]
MSRGTPKTTTSASAETGFSRKVDARMSLRSNTVNNQF